MKIPRVIFAGESSGCGKTTAVSAVLRLMKRRGLNVRACKCGPDYIDPMFHSAAIGAPCANLDPFFCDADLLGYILSENSGDVTVVEGVMGYYDGTGADGSDNSTYTVAVRTASPVILVVDGKGASASLIARIEGFSGFVPDSRIAGVLFTRTSPSGYAYAAKLTKRRFGDRVRPVGFIPELGADCALGSRRLGLVTADELADIGGILDRIADACESTVDIDAVLSIARAAGELNFSPPVITREKPVTIAVARDDAFCFYYHDTIALLEKMGAEIIYFSPLADEPVPERADGLLLGGGYPELHTEALEANTVAKNSVKNAIDGGMPTVAECGGFMYLGDELDGRRMCGALGHTSRDMKKLVRFGYVELTAKTGGLLGPAGTSLRAHEFHYYDSTDSGSAFGAVKPNGRAWEAGVMTETLYAGYPHLYLLSNLAAARSFYQKCLSYKEKKNDTERS